MSVKWIGLATLAMTIAGCGSLTKVAQNGEPEGEVVWPDVPTQVTFDNDRGTYGDMSHIALIREGATRDDIYQLIGRPQFHEGFHVREWDYLFHFPQENGAEVSCQYKILFDNQYKARRFFWRSVAPENATCPPAQEQMVTLSADALFKFNGASRNDLLPAGQNELNKLVSILNDNSIRSVEIYGFTDRLGSVAYNQSLSAKRAETVKQYLVDQGINAEMLSAIGKGEADPVKTCDGVKGRSALIDCLQPNRRVEVKINR